MNSGRKSYPKKKRLMYQEMMKFPKEYRALAISNLNKVRASQLMQLRKKFRGDIKLRVVKNKVVLRAFEKIGDVPRLPEFSNRLEGQCLLLFTNTNPFRLNLLFDKNKIFLPAKGGDIAPTEIIVYAGNTGITPGPVLSEFKEANVPTKIDQGSIWVVKDTRVARPGDQISQKLASLLSKLGVKPIEAGISVSCALADGLLFTEQDLRIDLDAFVKEVAKGAFDGLNLAIVCSYLTPETVGPLILQAGHEALNLSVSVGYITDETVKSILSSAHAQSLSVSNILKDKGYIAA
ncbi:MAG TPA: 50S ribosomal protein L10 [Nitrososphaeraceae archaeon]|nr:50S ribosomal protein L10 [Nitrososphaeraceae archaeon]